MFALQIAYVTNKLLGQFRLSDDAKINDGGIFTVLSIVNTEIGTVTSARSKLNFRVAKIVDFGETRRQQGGSHEQEVYRAPLG